MLSVIIPAYNEELNIKNTAGVVTQILSDNNIDFEIIFVNDGSSDNTLSELEVVSKENERVGYASFSRNFGKEAAIFAGLNEANGDCAVVMDCDLQHPVETIVEMYNIWLNNDVDIVEGRKADRGKESLMYKLFAKTFYKLIEKASNLDMQATSDFKLLDRKVIESLKQMPERLTFFRAMSSWVGFKTESVYFEVAPRNAGTTKFSFKGLVKYAISSITSFSSAPMTFVTWCGVLTFLVSVILGINTLYNKLSGNSLEGFSTVILLQLLTSSIIMFSLGIIGYYLSKIYEEIKRRPRYIISKRHKPDKSEENQK